MYAKQRQKQYILERPTEAALQQQTETAIPPGFHSQLDTNSTENAPSDSSGHLDSRIGCHLQVEYWIYSDVDLSRGHERERFWGSKQRACVYNGVFGIVRKASARECSATHSETTGRYIHESPRSDLGGKVLAHASTVMTDFFEREQTGFFTMHTSFPCKA